MFRRSFLAAAVVVMAAPAFAGDPAFVAHDPYMRSSMKSATSGAAFLGLENTSGEDDRLIGARSELDGMIELHTHKSDANGVMMMLEIEGGVPIAAGETHMFERGGDHLMFMGMSAPLEQGQNVPVTLIFEKAGEVEIVIPVDQERKPMHHGHDHDHMKHDHGKAKN